MTQDETQRLLRILRPKSDFLCNGFLRPYTLTRCGTPLCVRDTNDEQTGSASALEQATGTGDVLYE